MATVLESIDEDLAGWMLAQPVWFVASAPLSGQGHVNVSPKGMDGTFAVLGPRQVAYLDYSGSGAETIAHLRENARITIMFASFTGRPTIVRLHGRGRVVLAEDAEFADLRSRFSKERTLGQRAIVVVDVVRVADACGFSVPLMDFRADREVLDRAQEKRDETYFEQYWATKNALSIDGLPAMPAPDQPLDQRT